MKTHPYIAFLFVLVASCAPDSNSSASRPAERKSFTERMNEDGGYKQDSEGNWKPRSDKRSPYEGKNNAQFAGKGFKTREYKAGDYEKQSWWGNKEYDREAYAGDTDGSRFQKNSNLQGQGAREAATTMNLPDNYETDGYATSSAREAGTSQIEKSSNDLIEARRASYEQPEIIGWREQRAMSRDRVKGVLGR